MTVRPGRRASLCALVGLLSIAAGGCYKKTRIPPALEAYALEDEGGAIGVEPLRSVRLLFEPTEIGATRGRVQIVAGRRVGVGDYTREGDVVRLAAPVALAGGFAVGCTPWEETTVTSFELLAYDANDDLRAEQLVGSVALETAYASGVMPNPIEGTFVASPRAVGEWIGFDATNTTVPLDILAVPRGPLAPPPGVRLDLPITNVDEVRFLVDGTEVEPEYEVDSAGYVWALWLPRRGYPFGATISVASRGQDFAGRPLGGPAPYTFRTARTISDGRCEEDPATQAGPHDFPVLLDSYYDAPPIEGRQSCLFSYSGGWTGRLAVPPGATELALDARFVFRVGTDAFRNPRPFLAVTIARGDALVQSRLVADEPVTYAPIVPRGLEFSELHRLHVPLPEGTANVIDVAFDGVVDTWPPRVLEHCDPSPPTPDTPGNSPVTWGDLLRAE